MVEHDPAGFAAAVGEPIRLLREVVDATMVVAKEWSWTPAADSVAMAQIHASERFAVAGVSKTPLEDALMIAELYLAAAADHASSLCTLLESDPVVVLSDKVLGRAAIEAAGRADVLLDPQITSEQRVRRGVNERLFALDRQRAQASRVPERSARDAAARAAEEARSLFESAIAAGLGASVPGSPATVGEPRLSATKAIGRFFDEGESTAHLGGVLQAHWSDFAHSNLSGIMLRLEEIPASSQHRHLHPSHTLRALASSAVDARFVLGVAGSSFLITALHQRSLMGWESDSAWIDLVAAARDEFRRALM